MNIKENIPPEEKSSLYPPKEPIYGDYVGDFMNYYEGHRWGEWVLVDRARMNRDIANYKSALALYESRLLSYNDALESYRLVANNTTTFAPEAWSVLADILIRHERVIWGYGFSI